MLLLNRYIRICKLFIVCIFLFESTLYSQNLITNGSFENYTNIDCLYGGFVNNSTSVHVVDNWYTLNSCDYFNGVCASGNGFGIPDNLIGHSQSNQGSAYIGAILFAANYETKEYVYQQLSAPLQAGKMYCLSFYVSRADRITHAIHSIGAYFSNNVQSAASLGYVNVTPQIVNQNGFITDTIGWTQIQGCYTAIGGEQYITIGNFNSNANTDTIYVGSTDPHPSAYKYAYYYIDDIALIDQSTVGINELDIENGFEVYPNPVNSILNIEFDNFSDKEKLSIKITDLIGREILFSDYKSQLDISFFEKGIYFISIEQGTKTLGVKKIIKE